MNDYEGGYKDGYSDGIQTVKFTCIIIGMIIGSAGALFWKIIVQILINLIKS